METPEARRRTMQAVKRKNTGPELLVRKLLHSQGYRYRLHSKVLPGCPDLRFQQPAKRLSSFTAVSGMAIIARAATAFLSTITNIGQER